MLKLSQQLKELINNPKKIVITNHRSPDGDAMGSALAMSHFLAQLGHEVHVITPNDYAQFLHWMPGNEDVIIYEENQDLADKITNEAEIIFLMDLNNMDRLSSYKDSVSSSSAIKVLIDHHQDPDKNIGSFIFSDPESCSTAQLVYEIIESMGMNMYINKSMAECLYVGIMTDTGSFKYSSTTSRTHEIIAKLIELGVDNTKMHDLIYDNSTANRIKLLGYCLNEKLLLYPENNSAIISLTSEELKKFNFKKGDTEGFVNYALAIEGIRFAVFIAEKEGVVKLSLRSKGQFKVNIIAKEYFKGGGHMNAAGGISEVSVADTIKLVENIITKYTRELNNKN